MSCTRIVKAHSKLRFGGSLDRIIARRALPPMRFSSELSQLKPLRIPAKSEMHTEDFRFIDPSIPGKAFMLNINAGAQAVYSITHRVLLALVAMFGSLALSIWYNQGAPTSFLSCVGAVFAVSYFIFHVGHAPQVIGAFIVFALVKLLLK